jgi:hypothetical protein
VLTIIYLLKFKCDLENNKDAKSAIDRAKTFECKNKIMNEACAIFEEDKSRNGNYLRFKRSCQKGNDKRGQLVGCLNDNAHNYIETLKYKIDNKNLNSSFVILTNVFIDTKDFCIDYCLSYYSYPLAAFKIDERNQNGNREQCICMREHPSFIDSCKNAIRSSEPEEDLFPVYLTGYLGYFE